MTWKWLEQEAGNERDVCSEDQKQIDEEQQVITDEKSQDLASTWQELFV